MLRKSAERKTRKNGHDSFFCTFVLAHPENKQGSAIILAEPVLRFPQNGVLESPRYRNYAPCTNFLNAAESCCVTGPTEPPPMGRLSNLTTGMTSAAVPVKKHSSAMKTS
jgi:hypothetical protein